MKSKISYGLMETKFYSEDEEDTDALAKCSDDKCPRMIRVGELMYVDVNNGSMFCDSCGKCIRYARKKSYQRGEIDLQGRSIAQ